MWNNYSLYEELCKNYSPFNRLFTPLRLVFRTKFHFYNNTIISKLIQNSSKLLNWNTTFKNLIWLGALPLEPLSFHPSIQLDEFFFWAAFYLRILATIAGGLQKTFCSVICRRRDARKLKSTILIPFSNSGTP